MFNSYLLCTRNDFFVLVSLGSSSSSSSVECPQSPGWLFWHWYRGISAKKNKQTKNARPTGEACELLTWKRQETWLQQRLQAASHSSPGWFLAGMSAFDSSSGTEFEQVGVNVLAYLFLLVLVLLAPGSYWVFQSPPGPCCLRSYTTWWVLQFFSNSARMSI